MGKTMREWCRFSVCYWHTFRGTGADPFGMGTLVRPWEDGSGSLENAKRRLRAGFEFFAKLVGVLVMSNLAHSSHKSQQSSWFFIFFLSH